MSISAHDAITGAPPGSPSGPDPTSHDGPAPAATTRSDAGSDASSDAGGGVRGRGSGSGGSLRPLTPGTIGPVAGISFHAEAAARVCIGDDVVLAHDQTNPYDTDAVVITTTSGEELGHVPSTQQLNSRLLVGHRGGVFAGTVVDKVGRETVGLRVKIHSLIGHRPVAFGTGIAGRRDIEEPTPLHQSAEAPTSDRHATRAGADQERPLVQDGVDGGTGQGSVDVARPRRVFAAGSGRELGVLVEHSGHKVRVRRGDQVIAYPAGVVRLEDLPA